MCDILKDIAERADEAGGIDMPALRRVLSAVRGDWGGENAYIPKRGEKAQEIVRRRADEAQRLWRQGHPVRAVSRIMGISVKYTYKLLKKSPPSLK